jgi:hypothetical protein
MGRETSSLQLLAPLLLTGGKGADLVIRGNVVLNTHEAELCPCERHICTVSRYFGAGDETYNLGVNNDDDEVRVHFLNSN